MNTGCKLSIIIPTYNRPDQLEACLQSLAAQDLAAYNTEVIVVNDGQARYNVEVVRRFDSVFQLELCNQPQRGPSYARNQGARVARGRHLAFLDDDCGVGSDWIGQAAAALETYPHAMIGGTTVNGLISNPYATASQMLIDYMYAYQQTTAGPQFFTSNNMILPTASYRRLGGFNPQFLQPGGEDRDICYRWQQDGGQLVHIPMLTVFHYRQMDLAGFLRQHFGYGCGALRCHASQTNRKGRRLLRLAPLNFYLDMLTYAGKNKPYEIRVNTVRVLITLSQLAYAAGVSRALLDQNRPFNRR